MLKYIYKNDYRKNVPGTHKSPKGRYLFECFVATGHQPYQTVLAQLQGRPRTDKGTSQDPSACIEDLPNKTIPLTHFQRILFVISIFCLNFIDVLNFKSILQS